MSGFGLGEMPSEDEIDRTRTALIEYFESQARWRDAKAEETPEDARNGRSAAALRSVAEYVRRLPDNDMTLGVCVALHPAASSRRVGPSFVGEEGSRLARQYGYKAPPEDPGRWFGRFTKLLVREWSARGKGELEAMTHSDETGG